MIEQPDRQWTPKMHAIAAFVIQSVKPKFRGTTPAQAYKLARRLIDEALVRYRRDPEVPKLGCRPDNCFGCCLHQIDVDSSPYEADRILDHVEERGRLKKVVEKAERLVSHGKGGACPLLTAEGRCSVYVIRPLACAAYHSIDRTACHSGAKAKIPHVDKLWVETSIIAGFGMVPFDIITSPGPKPKHRLFQMLAARGRSRLNKVEAA